MRNRGGGSFGLILLVVVMTVVLLLVARLWKRVAPQAQTVTAPSVTDLPDLQETKKRTDAHSQQVQDAMAEVE